MLRENVYDARNKLSKKKKIMSNRKVYKKEELSIKDLSLYNSL